MAHRFVGRTSATVFRMVLLLCLVTAGSLSSQPARAAGPATLVKSFGDDVMYTGRAFEFKGKRFFVVERYDGSPDQLWRSDGTTAGTTVFQSSIGAYHVVNDILYFHQCDDAQETTCSLMKSDGTVAGTQLVMSDIDISSMFSFNNTLMFFTYWGLWRSDGTAAGTIPLKGNLRSGSYDKCGYPIRDFQTINGFLYFKVCHESFGSSSGKLQIWKTDGTAAGTSQVGPDLLYDEYSSADETPMVFLNGHFYVYTDYGIGSGWVRVNIATNTAESIPWFACGDTRVWKGKLFCISVTSASPVVAKIWLSDGTEAGTQVIKTFTTELSDPQFYVLSVTDTHIFLLADDGVHGVELWKTDGTTAGTTLVKDVNPGPPNAFDGYNLRRSFVNGVLFFMADDGVHGKELWKTDGTAAGTMLVKDITAGSTGSFLNLLENVDGTLLFTAQDFDRTTAPTLWKTDLLYPGATFIQDIAADTVLWQTLDAIYFTAPLSADFNAPVGLWQLPLSAIRTTSQFHITPDSGGTLNYTIAAGKRVTLTIPAGAVQQPTTLVLTPTATPDTTSPNAQFAGVAFTLEAYQNGVSMDDFAFEQPIHVELTYTDADVAGIAELSMKLYYLENGTWIDAATSCTPASTYERDTAQNTLRVEMCHLTPFALFGQAGNDIHVYLPMIIK